VSSHGAQLTNLIFVPPCDHTGFAPALVEVSLRTGWCNEGPPGEPVIVNGSKAALLERWKNCPEKRRYYHKADFFQLAVGMGIRYTEVIQEGVINYTNSNPINVKGILVDSQLIVQELRRLKENNNYDVRQHPSYNGWEGVEPYQIKIVGPYL
jgi:hypothetical protein